MIDFDEIQKFRVFNELKSVYRFNSVNDRKESSAEHSWSCLILADLILSLLDLNVDKLKVYELLMYHDVVEIESGDTPLSPNVNRSHKKELELKSMLILKNKLPKALSEKAYNLFLEFDDQKTMESKIAKAISALDAEIHEMDYKKDWVGWTKDFLIQAKQHYFEDIPELKDLFSKLLNYFEENNYFDSNVE